MSAAAHITLSQLAAAISEVIGNSFGGAGFRVLADVVDHKCDAQKGHHYFCLVEKDAVTHSVVAKMSAAAWRNGGGQSIAAFEAQTGQAFRSNIRVLVNVSVEYHPAYGLKLVLHDVDPSYTIGLLEQQRRETLHKLVTLCPDYIRLAGDRYETRNNGLRHAAVIQRIAVVSSGQAAGFKDFQDTILQNRFGYHIVMDTWFTAVQGEANAEGVCRRLIDIYQSGIAYDAVVIIRGGGSQTDLLLFDQFVLARAVAKFPIPIITGIGHQINQSIVDLMAHTPVKTPSIAAEFILAHNRQFEDAVIAMQQSIARHAGGYLALHKSFLAELGGALLLHPRMMTAAKQNDLDGAAHRLKGASTRYLAARQWQITHHQSVTRLLNPVNILKRGFAVIYKGGALVTDSDGIGAADEVSIRFYDAKLGAIITSKTSLDGTIAEL